jgi:hypothetical protein
MDCRDGMDMEEGQEVDMDAITAVVDNHGIIKVLQDLINLKLPASLYWLK